MSKRTSRSSPTSPQRSHKKQKTLNNPSSLVDQNQTQLADLNTMLPASANGGKAPIFGILDGKSPPGPSIVEAPDESWTRVEKRKDKKQKKESQRVMVSFLLQFAWIPQVVIEPAAKLCF